MGVLAGAGALCQPWAVLGAQLWARFGVDAHSLARAVSTCFYELPLAGWWLRAPWPHPSGGGVTV